VEVAVTVEVTLEISVTADAGAVKMSVIVEAAGLRDQSRSMLGRLSWPSRKEFG